MRCPCAFIDRRAEKLSQRTLMRIPPGSIPMQAYRPHRLEWPEERPPVWAWVSWSQKPAERLPAVADGWNDRVVVYWMSDAGELNTVVWRNAVTVRRLN